MSHDHAHEASGVGRAFAVGIALNITFVVIETVFGVRGNSTALLADAAHNVGDILGLAMAWAAFRLARVKPWVGHTYGLRRATILAALANAILLLAAVGAVAWEAIGRFGDPHPVQGGTMMVVAAVGVAVNGLSALLFRGQGVHDANVRGALLHLVADAAVSAGVVIAGAVVWFTGWGWVDPLTSLLVSAVILYGTWGLLRQGAHLALDGVPEGVDMERVRAHLAALAGVTEVRHLHVWALSSSEVALTVHLVMPWPAAPPAYLAHLDRDLAELGVQHATVQIDAPSPPETP